MRISHHRSSPLSIIASFNTSIQIWLPLTCLAHILQLPFNHISTLIYAYECSWVCVCIYVYMRLCTTLLDVINYIVCAHHSPLHPAPHPPDAETKTSEHNIVEKPQPPAAMFDYFANITPLRTRSLFLRFRAKYRRTHTSHIAEDFCSTMMGFNT